jgi:hypothetical protein
VDAFAGQKILAQDLMKIGPVAKYARRSGDGNQTLNAGDQILSFPTVVREDPFCGVTRQGAGNTSFKLEAGSYIMAASVRLTVNADSAVIYLAEGTTFTNEDNAFASGSPILNFPNGSACEPVTFDSATDVCVGMWRASTATAVTAWGKDLTHVVFIRLA